MYHFRNDYSEGAHPRVLEALIRTNLESTAGYGEDAYCAAAAAANRHFLCICIPHFGIACADNRRIMSAILHQTTKNSADKQLRPSALLFLWCSQQDLNLHVVDTGP